MFSFILSQRTTWNLQMMCVRWRRRDHVQKQMAKRLAKKRAAAEGIVPVKLTSFERLMASKKKTGAALSQEHPARPLKPLELPAAPERQDVTWIISNYMPQVHPLSEALKFLREVNDPQILNRPDAYVHLRLDLNMSLDKTNKYVTDTSKVVVLPHSYPHGEKRLILAFAKEVGQQAAAAEAGAEIIGGPELVKKILKGSVRVDEVDYVACHADMMQEVGPLRGLLRHRFPSITTGNITTDVAALIRHFHNAVKLKIVQDKQNVDFGVCVANIGRLDWPDQHLDKNIHAVFKMVCEIRPLKLGHFVSRALLMVPPERDYFIIDHLSYSPELPTPSDAKKKKAKKEAAQPAPTAVSA